MIDTVAIEQRFTRPLPANVISLYQWRPRYSTYDSYILRYDQKAEKNSHTPRLTYTHRQNGYYYLRAEVSLPKWLTGSNVESLSIDKISDALECLSNYVSEQSGLKFNAETGNVARVDFVEDRKINESAVLPLFERLFRFKHARMNKHFYNETSCDFTPKGKQKYKGVKIYSKWHEVLHRKRQAAEIEQAIGQIRFEVTLLTRPITSLVKEMKLPNREAQFVLTQQVASFVLEQEQRKLRYDTLFAAEKDIIQRILENPEITNLFGIVGFLEVYKRFGTDLYENPLIKCSKRSCQDYRSKCCKWGLLP